MYTDMITPEFAYNNHIGYKIYINEHKMNEVILKQKNTTC
jgi:hypothetical protein